MFYEEKNTKSFFGGLIAGAILGGLTGILFAPKSGRELRQNISDKSNELLDNTNLLIEEAKEKATGIVSDAKKKADGILSDAKKKVDGITNGAGEMISNGKGKIDEQVHKVKDAVKSGMDAYNDERYKSNKKAV